MKHAAKKSHASLPLSVGGSENSCLVALSSSICISSNGLLSVSRMAPDPVVALDEAFKAVVLSNGVREAGDAASGVCS